MPVARCPRCESPVTIDDADVGYEVECPNCRATFSTDDVLGLPTVRRARPRDDFDDDDRPRRRRRRTVADRTADARTAVFTPWLVASIVAVLSLAYHFADMMFVIANPGFLQNNPFGPMPFDWYVGARIFAMCYEAVILVGLGQMMRLKTLGFARVVMVMQIIPCAGICWIASVPLGIWGLIVLNRPDVVEGFELAAAGPRDEGGTRDNHGAGEVPEV